MKITLHFDPDLDSPQVLVLAVRADAVSALIADLLNQLAQWYWENPGDEQAAAFNLAYDWLKLELEKRGLSPSSSRDGVLRNRAGSILAYEQIHWARSAMAKMGKDVANAAGHEEKKE